MNIINISLDKSLLDTNSQAFQRLSKYTSSSIQLTTLIYSPLSDSRSEKNFQALGMKTNNPLSFILTAVRKAKKLHKKKPFDLIVTQDPHLTGIIGAILKKVLKIPLCVHFHADFYHNPYWIQEKPFLHRILQFISTRVVRKADGFRVVASKIKHSLEQDGVSSKNIQVVSTPIPLHHFLNPPKSKSFMKAHNIPGPYILFVGRLTAQKNIPMLLEVVHKLKARLVLAGNGELYESLQEQGADHIHFVGNLSIDELKQAYYESDFVVLPSFYEGTAKVIKEAAACSKAIITTNTSGVSDTIIPNKTGIIIANNNKRALKKQIQYLLDNPHVAENMGKLAKKHIQEESFETSVKKIQSIWKQTAQVKI